MLKKTVILLLCALPMVLAAQDKFGHINSQEILMAMPEITSMNKTLEELQGNWENEMVKMNEEYLSKIKEFQEKQATMPESIKQARQSEIVELEQRINTFQQTAAADLQQKQQELLAPIIDKMQKAIDEVGAENGYTYIFDLAGRAVVYKSPKTNDVSSLVKKKLGLQ